MGILTTLQELEAIYGSPAEASIVKEVDAIIPHYQRLIEASPFGNKSQRQHHRSVFLWINKVAQVDANSWARAA
jgi:hypothetical protein